MMKKKYVNRRSQLKNFVANKAAAFDVVIIDLPVSQEDVIEASISKKNALTTLKEIAESSGKLLRNKGLVFIYGVPTQLVNLWQVLPEDIRFRYWIAIDAFESFEGDTDAHLKHDHVGLLMLSRGDTFIDLDTKGTRMPHTACTFCGRNVKDWGGKKHLLNVHGAGVSDVWRDFFRIVGQKQDVENPSIRLNRVEIPDADGLNFHHLPKFALERLLSLVRVDKHDVLLLQIRESVFSKLTTTTRRSLSIVKTQPPVEIENKVILGDCIEVMEKWVAQHPEGIFDLVFADPPYNLRKDYKIYNDALADKEYVEWCDRWLKLSVKLTKPSGSLFFLNIPKWALYYAKTLQTRAFLQNWIVWDALSTPKGKIMPAHYALLYYTKSSQGFIYRNPGHLDSPEYCLRASCVRTRKNLVSFSPENPASQRANHAVPFSDIWWDIPRIKHKRDRDDHPCQLPDKLMDRIINCFSRPGDLVFDPFAGAGTTAICALKNGRNFTTIEIDPKYKKITEDKIHSLMTHGDIVRTPTIKKPRSKYTKKFLEQKVQEYSARLGRIPSLNEFVRKYSLDVQNLERLYADPRQVLKAGRVSLLNTVR